MMIHLIVPILILIAMVAAWQLPPEPGAIMGALLTISLVPQMVKEKPHE